METPTFPSPHELQQLEILKPRDGVDFISKQRKQGAANPRFLLERKDFLDFLGAIFNADIPARSVQNFLDLKLAPPPVQKDGKACFVFPDHFDLVLFLLKLRRHYHLALREIRSLAQHMPRKDYHLVVEQKLSLEALLDLSKKLPKGFGAADLVMAQTCDLMLEDLLPSSEALLAATEPGDKLRKLQEEKILARLEQIKEWVTTGRRDEFIRRESDEELRHLAEHQFAIRKIARKLTAKRRRAAAKGTRKS